MVLEDTQGHKFVINLNANDLQNINIAAWAIVKDGSEKEVVNFSSGSTLTFVDVDEWEKKWTK